MKWQEPILAAEKRAAFWNRSSRGLRVFVLLYLAVGLVITAISTLVLWAKTGAAGFFPSLIFGLVGGLPLASLFYRKSGFPKVRQIISLDEDSYSITGNVLRSGKYSQLVGFAILGNSESFSLILFHPEGYHLSVGIDLSIDVPDLRRYLVLKLPEIDPRDAPEPKIINASTVNK